MAWRRLSISVVAALCILVFDVLTPLNLGVWLLQVVLLWTVTLWADRRTLLKMSALCCLLTIAAFVLSAKTLRVPWTHWANLLMTLCAMALLTRLTVLRLVAEEERRRVEGELEASRARVKSLTGLLPICAWCRKIRGDTGDWESLERYVVSHSEADFTHGICEECSRDLRRDAESV